VPDGPLVCVHAERGAGADVEWGALDAWLDASQIRKLQSIRSSALPQ